MMSLFILSLGIWVCFRSSASSRCLLHKVNVVPFCLSLHTPDDHVLRHCIIQVNLFAHYHLFNPEMVRFGSDQSGLVLVLQASEPEPDCFFFLHFFIFSFFFPILP